MWTGPVLEPDRINRSMVRANIDFGAIIRLLTANTCRTDGVLAKKVVVIDAFLATAT